MTSAKFVRSIAAWAMVPVFFATILTATAAHAETYDPITGTGSTWAQNALDQGRKNVASNYGMTVNYSGTGSSAGRRDFIGGTVDYAVSEVPFQANPEDGSPPEVPPRGYAYVPIVAGGTALMYNLKIGGQQVTNLRLSGDTIAKIFRGAILNWNDSAIAADNPGLPMPDQAITPVVRSDASGSTSQFTLWMSKQYPSLWTYGMRSQYPTLPNFKYQSGSSGVAGYVSQNYGEGAITYVENAYAIQAGFPVAKVLNAGGYFVEPSANNVAIALLKAQIAPDLTLILDGVYNNPDPRTYPISSYSYMIVPTEVGGVFTAGKGKTLSTFAKYMLCEGQQQAADLGYSPLPMNLVMAGFAQVARIPGTVVAAFDSTSCNNPTFKPGEDPNNNLLVQTAAQPAACDARGPLQCGGPLVDLVISGSPIVGSVLSAPTWPSSPTTSVSYQWSLDNVSILGAKGSTYTVQNSDAGHYLGVGIHFNVGPSDGSGSVSTFGLATKMVTGGILSLTPKPVISGSPLVGSIVTAAPGTWDVGTVPSYQWRKSGTDIPGATGVTYQIQNVDAGQPVTVVVTGTNPGFNPVTKESLATAIVTGGTLSLVPTPSITGTPVVGSVLTGVTGVWDAGTTFTYQWRRAGVNIAGATASTYTEQNADAGQTLTVVVKGSKGGFTSVSLESPATPMITGGTLTLLPTPTISGTPTVGSVLPSAPGVWDSGVTRTYQWRRTGAAIAGATGSSYVPQAADVGQTLTVVVTGSKSGFVPVARESLATPIITGGTLVLTPAPTLSGVATVGSLLTAAPGVWDAATALTYQWRSSGTAIVGATASTYKLQNADAGQTVTVLVTGSKAGFQTVSKESLATASVTGGVLSLLPTPVVSGTVTVGSTLTATAGQWDPGVILSYQWRSGVTNIAGATASTYVVQNADAAKTLNVMVTGAKTGSTSVSRASLATATITGGTLLLMPTPAVKGTPFVGYVLTAAPGLWDAGVTLSYQWSSGWEDIVGATASTYKVQNSDAGQTLTVTVTATKVGFSTTARESHPTPMIHGGTLSSSPTPTVSGIPAVGSVLTVAPGIWEDGTALTYQWGSAGRNITGATGSTYVVQSYDLGQPLVVAVTGMKAGFVPLTTLSASTGNVLLAALTPTFSTPVKTATGFTVNITNYSALYAFTPTIAVGTAVITKGTPIGASLPLTISGMSVNASATVQVLAVRAGYGQGSATVIGTALAGAAVTPTFSAPVKTATGFTVNVTNYNALLVFTPAITAGSGTVTAGIPTGATLPLTITGMSPAQSTTLRVTATRTNYATGAATVVGSALPLALAKPLLTSLKKAG